VEALKLLVYLEGMKMAFAAYTAGNAKRALPCESPDFDADFGLQQLNEHCQKSALIGPREHLRHHSFDFGFALKRLKDGVVWSGVGVDVGFEGGREELHGSVYQYNIR
jgi:hypothetical protein